MSKSLADMKHEVAQVNRDKGWYEKDRTFGDSVALIHSEVSEALEAYRDWGLEDRTGTVSTVGDDGKEYPKPEGVGAEFADTLIRLLDACHRYKIDLEYEYHRKMFYNRTRPHRHGGKRL